jgi:hypothetical protein
VPEDRPAESGDGTAGGGDDGDGSGARGGGGGACSGGAGGGPGRLGTNAVPGVPAPQPIRPAMLFESPKGLRAEEGSYFRWGGAPGSSGGDSMSFTSRIGGLLASKLGCVGSFGPKPGATGNGVVIGGVVSIAG